MAHFYGRVRGSRGEATRMGTSGSGIMSTVETWGCSLRSDLDNNGEQDVLTVKFGHKTYPSRVLIEFEDPNTIADALDDPRIDKMVQQMRDLSERISKEAPKAIKRRKKVTA